MAIAPNKTAGYYLIRVEYTPCQQTLKSKHVHATLQTCGGGLKR
jgi:hypothetical protein